MIQTSLRSNDDAVSRLKVKIFADGADVASMKELLKNPYIKGFTTNPTLMRKAGISDYASFARNVLSAIPEHPVSFEVFADDLPEMRRQARIIASWGDNVYVKIPVTNTHGESTSALCRELSAAGVKLNVTALMTIEQVEITTSAMSGGAAGYVSVFAGRIADTGRNPIPLMVRALATMADEPQLELIWASPRELLNVFQANDIGCHVITATADVLAKLKLVGKDLSDYSLDTVKMFFADARASGFELS